MITRKMRLSMAMLTIAASVLTTGNIKADEKDTTNETNTATESKYANKAVADIYSTTTLNIRKKGAQTVAARRAAYARGVEVCAFKEYVGGLLGHARI